MKLDLNQYRVQRKSTISIYEKEVLVYYLNKSRIQKWMYPPGTFHLVNVVRAEDLPTSSLKRLAYQLHVLF
jgi:hypothetical protein